ncbi:MAG: ATP-binding protein [Synechococcus sp.]
MCWDDWRYMVDGPHSNAVETPHAEQPALLVHSERPIHAPGYIQPHGWLAAVSLGDRSILAISSNVSEFVGYSPEELLSQPIEMLLVSERFESLCQSLDSSQSDRGLVPNVTISCVDESQRSFSTWCHYQGDRLLLEFEPIHPPSTSNRLSTQSQLNRTIATLQAASDIQLLLERVVEEVRHYTQFDRVLAYQFDDNGSGSVVAESNGELFPSFLGLRFPAVDVPNDVRELYTRCHIRYVRDVEAAEIELLSTDNDPQLASTLDLTYAILRSPDPCSIQYLKNIGVSSLLFLSLIRNGHLWGFISCHNTTATNVSTDLLATCELLGQIASLQLSSVSQNEDRVYRLLLQSVRADFIRATRNAETLKDALFQQGELLLRMVGASGAAFCVDGHISLQGNTPTIEQVRELLLWLKAPALTDAVPESLLNEDVFATHHLATIYPGAEDITTSASGLLLLWISRIRNSAILWFRPELLHTVDWAGEPSANVHADSKGIALTPRNSFEMWQETVKMQAEPWKPCEIDSANELRNSLVNLLIAKLEELAQTNRELERSNNELDSFAYAASHDLKEPLRGIHNYSMFLLEDYADRLDEGGLSRLKTLVRLTHRMDSLIDVLLQFAQIGREDLQLQSVDLNGSVQQAIELVTVSRRDIHPTFTIPRSLPTIDCDPVLMEQVFSNLFSNALKYTNSSDIQVEVGYLTPDEFRQIDSEVAETDRLSSFVLYVKDNGIGIRKHHLKTIFRLFKRLHAPKKYGGGTGAGLTIVKKIVERHGGQIWVSSEYGTGSTFFIANIDRSA